MRLSNFRLDRTEDEPGLKHKVFYASVDVTTGWFKWKKVVRLALMRHSEGEWIFTDSNEEVPKMQMIRLTREWKAQTGQSC